LLVNRPLRQIITEQEIAALDGDALLSDQVDLDSIDFLSMVAGISDEAHIDIPERDYPCLTSLSGTYAYVRSRITS
jgi:acyl carrier protein